MGYSNNSAVIARVRPLLDQMVKATSDLVWPSKDPHMLGYHIREAMTYAKAREIDPYKGLKSQWIIRNRGDRVVAERRDVIAFEALQSAMQKMEIENLHSVVEIVGAAIAHKAHHIYFPDAILTPDERLMLWKWARSNEYYIVVAEVGVTLTKENPGEAAWTPE